MLLTGRKDAIAAALAGGRAVMDHSAGDVGVVARGLLHPDLAPAGSGDALELKPIHLVPETGPTCGSTLPGSRRIAGVSDRAGFRAGSALDVSVRT